MKQHNLPLRNMILVILNTFTFIIGLFAFLNSRYILAAFMLLILSLLNIYQLIVAKTEETETIITEDEDKKWEYLKKIQTLTEDNQKQVATIEQLRQELQNALLKKDVVSSDLYDFPLSSTTAIDLNKILLEYVECFKEQLAKKNINCTYSSTYDGSPVFLSLSAINTILHNLFDNAFKFTPYGGNVMVNVANSNQGVLIIMKNTSPAILSSELEQLFHLNYQGSNKKSGTGLGLAQVSAIVRDYGGTIYAKSNQDTGFTIYMDLPEQKTSEQSVEKKEEEVTSNEK